MNRVVLLRHVPAVQTVWIVLVCSSALHLWWWRGIATTGGDLAAQDQWATFAGAHPGAAYSFAWYGGLPPASYSPLSGYVMAFLGVRPTGVICGVISSVIVVLILRRMIDIRHIFWPSMVAMLALWCNTVSGRITFSEGLMFALAAVWAMVGNIQPRWLRFTVIAVCALLATLSSSVAGLFLGLIAGGLFLAHRRIEAYVLGIPPVIAVAANAFLFHFEGAQPYPWYLVLPAVVCGLAVWTTVPREWKWIRRGALVYLIAVFGTWFITSPIGSNIDRMAMIFGPVILLAIIESGRARNPFERVKALRFIPVWGVAVFIFLASFAWNFIQAGLDIGTNSYATVLDVQEKAVIAALRAHRADLAMVEFVPTASHREASAFAADFNMVRGWNRQADVKRDALFYDDGGWKVDTMLTPEVYRRWLQRWAVGYVVLPPGNLDYAAKREGEIVRADPAFLHQVWSANGWHIYQVMNPAPVIDGGAQVIEFSTDKVAVSVPNPGSYLVKIYYADVLGIIDPEGDVYASPKKPAKGEPVVNLHGCLAEAKVPIPDLPDPLPSGAQKVDHWTTLVAPTAGTYVIQGLWSGVPTGTACPKP